MVIACSIIAILEAILIFVLSFKLKNAKYKPIRPYSPDDNIHDYIEVDHINELNTIAKNTRFIKRKDACKYAVKAIIEKRDLQTRIYELDKKLKNQKYENEL